MASFLPLMTLEAATIHPGAAGDHSDHFVPAFDGMAIVSQLNRDLAFQTASFPLGPTATSVVFSSSTSDGASRFASGYTEGAMTLGRGQRSLAVTYQATTFDALDDLDLRASDINLFGEHVCCSGDESERDLMVQTLSLRLHRKVVGLVFGYGVTDQFEVGVVVPFVEVAADGRVTSRILRTATSGDQGIHQFDEIGLANRTIPSGGRPPAAGVAGTGSSTARGFGDIVLRGKFRLFQEGGHALAAGVDVRLPTGDSDELIGLGATQLTPSVMWSTRADRFGARARFRYTRSSGELSSLLSAPGIDLTVPDELGYELGFDVDVAPRTTIMMDVVGRRLSDVSSFSQVDTVFPSRGPGPLPSADYLAEGALRQGPTRTINMILGAPGVRIHMGGAVFANLRVLFPMATAGLRPAPSGVFNVDYGF